MRTPRLPRRKRRRVDSSSRLPAMALECISKLAHLLQECGLEREDIGNAFSDAGQELLELAVSSPRRAARDTSVERADRVFPIANQVVTEWRKDPRFADERGKPRLLPRNGARSVTALVRGLRRSANVSEILSYLIDTETVGKAGARYQLLRPWIRLRGKTGPWFQLRYVHGTLTVSSNNLHPQPDTARFQRMVEHVSVPVSKLPLIERHLERRGMAVLDWFDDLLRRYAAEQKPGEPAIWLAVALHLLQEDSDSRPKGSDAVKIGTGMQKRNR
jgi:hypothetical protein